MDLFYNNTIILLGILFIAHSIFFIHAAKSIHRDRYRKIFTNFVAIYLLLFVITLGIYLFVIPNQILTTIAFVEILFLPIGIIGASILATRYYDVHHNTRDHQVGIMVLMTLVSLFLFQEKDSFILVVAIALCITTIAWELYFYNEQTSETNKKQEKINGTKTEFLSFATHQLRSPLTQIKWGLNAVADKVQSQPEILGIVQQLRITSDEMISTINDLLDISKIEQGGFSLKNEPIDLVEFLELITNEFILVAKAKKLHISFQNLVTTAPIIGDQTKLRQVFINIIDNAIKYTLSGSVTIKLEKHPKNNCYIISIIDTGSGIAPEEIPKLFTKFSRGNAGKIFMEGSGLGLYLSKKITEVHKGAITAHSAGIGMGSTFIISLPKK